MGKVLITGCSGFIGQNLTHFLIRQGFEVIGIDQNPYPFFKNDFHFFQYRLGNYDSQFWQKQEFKKVSLWVHLASESHVDRSISSPQLFVDNNIHGTLELFDQAKNFPLEKLILFSTDEVGACLKEGSFYEKGQPYNTGSVYSVTKATQELLAQSYCKKYQIPIYTTRCVNVFGPHQAKEKLIPTIISHALQKMKIPVYGHGMQKRQWCYVDSVCEFLNQLLVSNHIPPETILHMTGTNEIPNLVLIHVILSLLKKNHLLDTEISHVKDRLGHDERYSLGLSHLTEDFDLTQYDETQFISDLTKTVEWYLNQKEIL